jgi:hypothetical protein
LLTQQRFHTAIFNNQSVVNNGDIATQLLGFFQIMGGKNDRRPLPIDFPQKFPPLG